MPDRTCGQNGYLTLTCDATPPKSAFGMPDPGSEPRVGVEHDEVVPGRSRVTARPTIALAVARNGLGRAVQEPAPVLQFGSRERQSIPTWMASL